MGNMPIKCSNCHVQAQVILEGNNPQRVVCPRCGASERYAKTRQSIDQQASAYAREEIDEAIMNLVKGNKNIRYKPGNVRSQPSKFRVDFSR